MNLDLINEMWSQDSIIDPDNLHEESIKTPRLHAKYHELYNTVLLLKKKEEHNHKTKYLERRNYYNGKADPEVYEDDPFPYKVREKDSLNYHLDADPALQKIRLKIDYHDAMLTYLESVLKQISNRTYQIKNAIEWQNFQRGF